MRYTSRLLYRSADLSEVRRKVRGFNHESLKKVKKKKKNYPKARGTEMTVYRDQAEINPKIDIKLKEWSRLPY